MSVDSKASLTNLLDFLDRLDQHRISYRLERNRSESIMVLIAVPGERWEVEVMDEGHVEVERFLSDGTISGEETLDTLFTVHGSSGEQT